MKSWLFNRDPYVMFYFNPHKTGTRMFIPYIPLFQGVDFNGWMKKGWMKRSWVITNLNNALL